MMAEGGALAALAAAAAAPEAKPPPPPSSASERVRDVLTPDMLPLVCRYLDAADMARLGLAAAFLAEAIFPGAGRRPGEWRRLSEMLWREVCARVGLRPHSTRTRGRRKSWYAFLVDRLCVECGGMPRVVLDLNARAYSAPREPVAVCQRCWGATLRGLARNKKMASAARARRKKSLAEEPKEQQKRRAKYEPFPRVRRRRGFAFHSRLVAATEDWKDL